MLAETLPLSSKPEIVIGIESCENHSPLGVSEQVKTFSKSAMQDALKRAGAHFECETKLCETPDQQLEFLIDAAQTNEVKNIVTAYAPVGPTADKLAQINYKLSQNEIHLVQILRDYDAMIWPYATRGFFKVKKQIPKLLDQLKIS